MVYDGGKLKGFMMTWKGFEGRRKKERAKEILTSALKITRYTFQ